MEERRGSRGSPGRKRIGQSPGVEPGKRRSPNNARSRSPEKRSSKPKERPGPAKPKETALERKEREEKEAKEKKQKEDQEYQERLSKLSTPEREVLIVYTSLCRIRTNSFPDHGGSEEEVRGKVECERGQDQDLPQDVSIHPKPGSGGSFVSYLNGYCVCSSQRSTNVS